MIFEKQYINLVSNIIENGERKEDRTGVGTISLFAPPKFEIYLDEGFPLLTIRKMPWQNMIKELIWFISGSTNVNDLAKSAQIWWKPWANENGDLGPIYPALWRTWPHGDQYVIDQLGNLINGLKNNPTSRRHIISTWHPGEIQNMALPPCHGLVIQFYVHSKDKLSCFTHQRSADMGLGIVSNIPSYTLLLMMVAQVCNLIPYRLSYSIGDAHIYSNHVDILKDVIGKKTFPMPKMEINKEIDNIDNFSFGDFNLINYQHNEAVKMEIAV